MAKGVKAVGLETRVARDQGALRRGEVLGRKRIGFHVRKVNFDSAINVINVATRTRRIDLDDCPVQLICALRQVVYVF
ncbi:MULTISPECIES: hypothetical protein [Paraburkholderia]|uniref:Transposase n=1 Tax=Paraburkholderia podalyriae TaxID=1938811 RepID=A0ABR7Q3B1_9BURK|nr:hypothetical protein [Paraburkholderia podalyriae]MBC8752901.1 hypothetical protein [Paraburkholderia podalyriae]